MTKALHLALWPRDGLFLKNGRGWYTSDVGRSHAHAWPYPHTVRGALRAAWGQAYMAVHADERLKPEDWEEKSAPVRVDKLLSVRRPVGQGNLAAAHRMWPAPADAWRGERGIEPLEPCSTQGLHGLDVWPTAGEDAASEQMSRDEHAFAKLWRPLVPRKSADTDADAVRFWSEPAFCEWLQTWPPAVSSRPMGASPGQRTDIHVTIDADTRAATPAMLFSCEVTETLQQDARGPGAMHEWGIALQCRWPDDTHPGNALVLGGRRRVSRVESLSGASAGEVFAPPAGEFFDRLAGSRGLRIICVTPARFSRGWLPDGFTAENGEFRGRLPKLDTPVILRAALVPRAEHVSPWNTVARKPRPTVSLVPAGAVYFFENADRRAFSQDECRALWFATWGHPPENGPGPNDGLGLVVPGRWQLEQQG